MEVLRTPDDRFSDLAGYSFQPHYVEIGAGDGTGDRIRVHYVDERPPDGREPTEVVLMLHGEPSWSFLYRHMIPPLVDAGHRCVAPDLPGFGRSDKPTPRAEYTYQRHVDWLREVVFDQIDLHDITLVAQDWGGLLGLRLVAEQPDRFRRVVVANTFLPTGDQSPGEAFLAWQRYSQRVPELDIGAVIQGATTTELPADVLAGYDAPFPDERFKEGARQFPVLVPTSPEDPAAPANRAAWTVLDRFERPFLCAFSDGDPVTAGAERIFQRRVPGCAGQDHTVIEGGGHFLQEDRGSQLADVIVQFIATTPA